jgi:hypothetical protein
VASYVIYRTPAVQIVGGALNGGWACPAVPPPGNSPRTPPAGPYIRIIGIADKSAAGVAESPYSFNDSGVTSGSVYCYQVASVDAAGQTGTGTLATSTMPGPNAAQA